MNVRVAVFCCAAVLRLGTLFLGRPPLESAYWDLAGSLRHSGTLAVDGVKTTDFEPGYPFFLAVARTLVGDHPLRVQVCQIAIASLGAVFLYQLALVLSGRPRVALASGALFAVYPLLVHQAPAASDAALTTTVLVAFAYCFVSAASLRGWAAAGACLGLAVLTRSMIIPLVGLAAAILLVRRQWMPALAFTLAALVVIAPLPARNGAVNGSWWPTRSGVNLYVGNSPHAAALIPRYDVDLLQDSAYKLVAQRRPDLVPGTPAFDRGADALLSREAFAYMAERPLRTLGQKLRNAAYMVSPLLVPYEVGGPDTVVVVGPGGQAAVEHSVPRSRSSLLAHGVSSTCVLLAAMLGIYLRRREIRRDAILWAIVLTFVAVHAVYFPATRYTAPMIFVLLFYSAIAIDRIAGRNAAGLSYA